MTEFINRSINEPDRGDLPFQERWRGPDKGLINCWEIGRRLARENPELAEKAKNDELPSLGWKGGSDTVLKVKKKYGVLFYLAEWQGLRADDLNIDLSKEYVMTCSKTGLEVTFTLDFDKYGNA